MIEWFEQKDWHPLGAASEVPPRHVYQTTLAGQELAVWRDDLGNVNVWENRCPHRGLRLSLGINNGTDLRCQYHGWTYESGSGMCTFVPAHRQVENASNACARTFPVREFAGLIWSTLGVDNISGQASETGSVFDVGTNLRSAIIKSDATQVRQELLAGRECFGTLFSWDGVHEFPLLQSALSLQPHSRDGQLVFFIQPHSAGKCVLHPVLYAPHGVSVEVQKNFAIVIAEMRRKIERQAEKPRSASETFIPLATVQEAGNVSAAPAGRQSPYFECRVTVRKQESQDIVSFRLSPIGRGLPRLVPGMHVNVETPSGMVRQYSIVNRPDETQEVIIAVKREAASRGGSRSMHDDVNEGTTVKVSLPRNGFPLRANDRKVALFAGGIGITPILGMAHALQSLNKQFSLHYFARGMDYVPFSDRLARLGNALYQYFGLNASESLTKLEQIIENLDPHTTDIYVCGPALMIEAVKSVAKQRGFMDENIRFEYFSKADSAIDATPFEVELARSARTFTVPADTSLLKACASHGVHIDSSCEQGICGSCTTKVLSGEILHRDSYLTDAEKASGNLIVPCVSRAAQGKLVLDL
jgi:ferredoxin-NADP reductase/nitrite reductase/ring-hydroxylating ferredoxin subunit